MRRSLGMNIFCRENKISACKYGLFCRSALTVVQIASTSVLYTQTLWRTRDLRINVVIFVFGQHPLLMSALRSILA